jgi:gamma-glutamyltranspeptidase/glutathione hydrolase
MMQNARLGLRGATSSVLLVCLAWPAALLPQGGAPDAAARKFAQSSAGMVAAGTPYAARAAVELLESGGNAMDAAAAAAFALMVTDPPMTSLAGRTQMLIARPDGSLAGIDGATLAPAGVPPRHGDSDLRAGYALVPVPGNPAALALAVEKFGRRKLADVMAPAIALAEKGFAVTPVVGAIWRENARRMAENPAAAEIYLQPGGSGFGPGDVHRNQRLAQTLKRLAAEGPDFLYRGAAAEALARDVKSRGGYVEASDLAAYRPLEAVIHRTKFRGLEVASTGRRAWGGTLAEMLQILSEFEPRSGAATPQEIELLARAMSVAIADRVAAASRPEGAAGEEFSTAAAARRRAGEIREAMRRAASPAGPSGAPQPHETTHLAVMDSAGMAVSLTTSIGPRFGSRIASPELGFLYAYSYRMRDTPTPRMRDETEMTPTIVLRHGKPWLAIGAAGSERIPGAVLQVLLNLVEKKMTLAEAVAAPRIFSMGSRLQLDARLPAEWAEALGRRGFQVEVIRHEPSHHLGIVHAVLRDPASRSFFGAADPVYDGAAAGPAAHSATPRAATPARQE